MTLGSFWFGAIAVLWTGFFVLEGFDFGVGMLHGVAGKDEAGRRAAINAIGPLWDGNEVWLIVAGAAMFAAFPGWYATMFSGFYLAMVLLLLALIARGVALEYRGKRDSAAWRRAWDRMLTGSSLLAPLVIGIALGDLLHGLPVNGSGDYTGSFWTLFQPYALYTGVTLVAVCVLHGACFLTLKTDGAVRDRAGLLARRAAPLTALVLVGYAVWTGAVAGGGFPVSAAAVVAVLAAFSSTVLTRGGTAPSGGHPRTPDGPEPPGARWRLSGKPPGPSARLTVARREGWAFAATTVTMAATVLALFTQLYPRVMVSSTRAAYDLTIRNTAAGGYSLRVMTVVVAIFAPVVLAYTAWTYYVFRRRISPALGPSAK
jgi:cytochrome d ubiquinol oxidase subunit II